MKKNKWKAHLENKSFLRNLNDKIKADERNVKKKKKRKIHVTFNMLLFVFYALTSVDKMFLFTPHSIRDHCNSTLNSQLNIFSISCTQKKSV